MKAKVRVPRGGIRFNERKLVELVGQAARDAMLRAASDIREQTRRSMSHRNTPKRVTQFRVGEKDGRPLVAEVRKMPKGDRVTSWKSPSQPEGLLYSSIRYYYDTATKSVVVGPERMKRVGQIHEFGGSVPVYFTYTGSRKRRSRKFPGARFGMLSNNSIGQRSIYLGQRRVKRRPYLSKGFAKAAPKIPLQFKNRLTVSGRKVS